MNVTPRLLDVAEQLVALHRLVVLDRRDDVPVAERPPAAGRDDRKRAPALQMHRPRLDAEDRRPVSRGDVDAEVEAARRARDARVVEVAAHRMRPVERANRPAVRPERRHAESFARCSVGGCARPP